MNAAQRMEEYLRATIERLKYEPCTEAASEESRIEFYQHVR